MGKVLIALIPGVKFCAESKNSILLTTYFPYNIIIDNVPLERKGTTTFLSFIIDENLNWNEHVISLLLFLGMLVYYIK